MSTLRSIASEATTLAISVTLAIIIWTVAVRANDPITTKSLELEVQQVGLLPVEAVVTQAAEKVRITIEGPKSVIEPLDTDNFKAYVDLSQISVGETETPIVVQFDLTQVELVFQEPTSTLVTAEQVIDREVPVRVRIRGEAARGHTANVAVSDPPTIMLTGPASAVNQIQDALVTVFLDGAREDVVRVFRPIFYDAQGAVSSVRGLQLSTEEVTVTVPIEEVENVADKAINVDWSGEPATGYRLLNVTVEPSSVLVSGPPALLQDIRVINTEPIDISGLNASFTQRVTLVLPDGIQREEVQPVVVEFDIEPILTTSVVRRTPEVRALAEGLTATLEPEQVTVFLFGPLPVLDSIIETDVSVTVDLLDLDVGTHSVEPIVTVLANGVEVRSFQPEFVTVTISETADVQAGTTPGSTVPATTPTPATDSDAALPVPLTANLNPNIVLGPSRRPSQEV